MSRLQIAISLNIFTGRSPGEQGIAPVAAAGFEALDFNFYDLLNLVDWSDQHAADALVSRYREAAITVNLPWAQSHGPMFHMFGKDPESQKRINCCPAAIRASGQLGVPWMVLHPDGFPGAFDRDHRKRVREANIAFFRKLLPTCEKHNVGLALENIFDASARSRGTGSRHYAAVPDELCELIDELNHPLIGACWDTGHAQLMGLDQRSAIASLGGRLKAVHIQDNNGLDDDHAMPFTTGPRGVDWQAVADGLRLADYRGALSCELHNCFRRLPQSVFDGALTQAAQIARHIVSLIDNHP